MNSNGTRVIIATGIWNLVLNLACLPNDKHPIVLLFFSHICDKEFNENFYKQANKLHEFIVIKNIGNCIYKNASKEGYNNGDIAELDELESIKRFNDIKNEINLSNIESVSIPHYFAPKMRTFIKAFNCSNYYCVEEGLNSYYRHYDKLKLSNADLFCTSHVKTIYFAEYLNIKHIFPYHRYGVKVKKIAKERITTELDKFNFINLDNTAAKILILGQYGLNEKDIDNLYMGYIETISKLLSYGIKIYFVPHPRDRVISKMLVSQFLGDKFVLLKCNLIPAECLCSKGQWMCVISNCSTASLSIPHLFGIPSFIISRDVSQYIFGKGDLINSHNYCLSVLPTLDQLIKEINTNNIDETIKKIFNSKKSDFKNLQKKYLSLRGKNYNKKQAGNNDWYRTKNYILNLKKSDGRYEFLKNLILLIRVNPLVIINIKRILNQYLEISANLEKKSLSPFSYKNTRISILENLKNKQYKRSLLICLIRLINKPLSFLSNIELICLTIKKILIIKNRNNILSFSNYITFKINKLRLIFKSKFINKKISKNNSITFLTYRKNKGPFGGPGGVLYLEKVILGKFLDGKEITYNFFENQDYYDAFFDIQSGTEFAIDQVRLNHSNLYVAHDLGTAYGLVLANVPFVMFWHFQGSLVTQQLNFGFKIPNWIISEITNIERLAFNKAKFVVFPSLGAQYMYVDDPYSCSKNVDNEKFKVIYNTSITDNSPVSPISREESVIDNFNGIKIVTCGTLTSAKGQDLAIEFLLKLNTNQNILWICIGDGVLKDELHQRSQALINKGISVLFISKLPHSNVLRIMKNADIYLMCHRISIFDIATLEAMQNSCALILSRVGGNIDFNKSDNVIFTDEIDKINQLLVNSEILETYKDLTYKTFLKFFSPLEFFNAHRALLNHCL